MMRWVVQLPEDDGGWRNGLWFHSERLARSHVDRTLHLAEHFGEPVPRRRIMRSEGADMEFVAEYGVEGNED